MKFRFIAFGKLKNPGLRLSADHYLKFLSNFSDITETELRSEVVTDKSPKIRKAIQIKEAELIAKKLTSKLKTIMIVLDESGKNWSTLEWAKTFQTIENEGHPEIAFIIGSSLGLDESIRAKAHYVISLGRQTLPHELARVVLFEQCARAMSVLKKHPYHHEGS